MVTASLDTPVSSEIRRRKPRPSDKTPTDAPLPEASEATWDAWLATRTYLHLRVIEQIAMSRRTKAQQRLQALCYLVDRAAGKAGQLQAGNTQITLVIEERTVGVRLASPPSPAPVIECQALAEPLPSPDTGAPPPGGNAPSPTP